MTGWLDDDVQAYGATCKAKLAGPGEREALIRNPIETLLTAAAGALGVDATFHDEVGDPDRQVRPDYAVTIEGAICGHIEVKAPAKSIEPSSFRGHDKVQWEKQRDLPNLALHERGCSRLSASVAG